ncbi:MULTISPECIES: hypothetical protein [unclassified Sphingobacterium]|uniref:hypothetical protein n=1 Tax=unclassified Sphingobacterium TaxID=2609468 RepID=UPI0010517E9A|nr:MULTISPECIES: hypothetical protein [unclassified Sphingobacterium]MCS3557012.1 hypothetical protein [Sphingobacterium sp. JUb21]TCQ99014.1 hypothetical protein EDF66_116124 [Sphingobacterium sp. JUb20]
MVRNINWLGLFVLLSGITLTVCSCQNRATDTVQNRSADQDSNFVIRDSLVMQADKRTVLPDTIVISKKHDPNVVVCDMDGDSRLDTVHIVQNTMNNKYGLKVSFGNKKTTYLGMGQDILGQGFDDIDWVGIFEKVPRGEIYYNNVSDEGEIMTEDEVDEKDKIKLPHDGVFIHQAEACGGGIIYMNNGKFEWIQQE